MSRFNIGDKVRCIRGNQMLAEGEIYTVAAYAGCFGERVVGLEELEDTGAEWDGDRFELVEPRLTGTEQDPNGISAHTKGAKLDAGKLRPALVLNGFANALEAVVKVGTAGAVKYTDNGWKYVPNGYARYEDAEGRHRMKRGKGETHDKDSGSLHLAHEAWNALAKLELYLKEHNAK